MLVVLPPGETDLQCARFNIMAARTKFVNMDVGGAQHMGEGRRGGGRGGERLVGDGSGERE